MKIKILGSRTNPGVIIDSNNLPAVKPVTNPVDTNKFKGMGDIVHLAANPVAKIIDKIAGTNLQGCGKCAKRRETLNNLMPF